MSHTYDEGSVDLRGKRVYISGPMTGYPSHNVAEFARFHELLSSIGVADVYDPALEWYKRLFSAAKDMSHEQWICRTLHQLTCTDMFSGFEEPHYDVILMLDGWEQSDGCTEEFRVAKACGIRVVELRELRHGEEQDQ